VNLEDKCEELNDEMNQQQHQADDEADIERRQQPAAMKQERFEKLFVFSHGPLDAKDGTDPADHAMAAVLQ
jgi:hypothetical protein